jgi:hypothetical protein
MTFGQQASRALGALVAASALVVVLAVPSEAQSPLPSSSPSAPSSSQAPSGGLPHDAPDLEARIPDSIDGAPLVKGSFGAPTWEQFGLEAAGQVAMIAQELGVDASAVEFAFANDPTASPLYNVFLIRVIGVPPEQVVELYGRLATEEQTGSTLDTVTLGGIEVSHLAAPANPVGDVWFFAQDDAMVGIQTSDAAAAEMLFQALAAVPAGSPAQASTAP